MSYTGFQKIRGFEAQKDGRDNFHVLGVMDSFPAYATVLEVAATDTIPSDKAPRLRVKGKGGAVTMTSTPHIATPTTPVKLMLEGTDNAAALTLQSETNLASSGLLLAGGTNAVLAANDVLVVYYSIELGKWLSLGAVAANA